MRARLLQFLEAFRGRLHFLGEIADLLDLADLDDLVIGGRAFLRPFDRLRARDFTLMIQQPPSTSLAAVNGPSVTMGLPVAKETRAPIEGGCSPVERDQDAGFLQRSS